MVHDRMLVVYFSQSGTTRRTARAIQRMLGCSIEELHEAERRDGLVGNLRTLLGGPAPLAPQRHDPADYDVVIVGAPVRRGALAHPVSTWLDANQGRLRRLAFFCTHDGRGATSVLHDVDALSACTSEVTLVLRRDEVGSPSFDAKVRTFASVVTRGATPTSGRSREGSRLFHGCPSPP